MSSVDTSASDTSSVDMNFSSPAFCEVVPDDGTFRDIVHYIYKFFNKGNLEPLESFIRVSKRLNQQYLLQFDVEPVSIAEAPLQVSNSGYFLISSACHSHDPEISKSEVCVHIVEGEPAAPTREQLFERLMDTVQTRDVHHTTQHNGTSNLTNIQQVPLNLKKTYGIYSEVGHGFLDFLLDIGRKIGNYSVPFMQGSLRTSDESGSYLFIRNQNPRLFGGDVEGRMFIIYKLVTSEISYWKTTAEQLSVNSIACCRICATSIEADLGACSQCIVALRAYDGHSWLTNFMQGILPCPEGSEDSDGYDSDDEDFLGYRRLQDRWKRSLAGYPRLDEGFEHLGELLSQYMKFAKWSSDKRQARWKR